MKLLFIVIAILLLFAGVFWLVSTPKKVKLQDKLVQRTSFNYNTNLSIDTNDNLPDQLMLRRVRNSQWEMSGVFTNPQITTREEPSMSVDHILPEAYLIDSINKEKRILIGRYNDRGSGLHGWHVTMIKQGESEINFERHQRYRVWIEEAIPEGFENDGTPIVKKPKRWYFSGLTDIIDTKYYNGYIEPTEGGF